MAKTTISDWQRSIHIASSPPVTGGMTVRELRAMVAALDEAGIADGVRVSCRHDDSTRHLTGLWVQAYETLPDQGGGRGE